MGERFYKKILIVDDDQIILKMTREYLSQIGYHCESASNAREAFNILDGNEIDLVIADIVMPVMDGLTFMQEVKETSSSPDFIIMTGYSSEYAYVDIINAGAADYITKPFEVRELQARILRMEKEKELIHEIQNTNEQLQAAVGRANSLTVETEIANMKLKKEIEKRKRATNKIKILSITDPLTGCFNRRYLNSTLPKEIARARRYNHPFSIVMADIDHFKKINDAHGHNVGDRVLKNFVQHMQATIRNNVDWVSRYGGEEFLICLPETGIEGACRMLERLQATISQHCGETSRDTTRFTASFGVTSFHADAPPDVSPEALINAADTYLYEAKQQGRDRFVSGPYRS